MTVSSAVAVFTVPAGIVQRPLGSLQPSEYRDVGVVCLCPGDGVHPWCERARANQRKSVCQIGTVNKLRLSRTFNRSLAYAPRVSGE